MSTRERNDALSITQELQNPDPRIAETTAQRLGHTTDPVLMTSELFGIIGAILPDTRSPFSSLGEHTISLCEDATHRMQGAVCRLAPGVTRNGLLHLTAAALNAILAWSQRHGAGPHWPEQTGLPCPVLAPMPISPRPAHPMLARTPRNRQQVRSRVMSQLRT